MNLGRNAMAKKKRTFGFKMFISTDCPKHLSREAELCAAGFHFERPF